MKAPYSHKEKNFNEISRITFDSIAFKMKNEDERRNVIAHTIPLTEALILL